MNLPSDWGLPRKDFMTETQIPVSHQVRNSLKADEGVERQSGYNFLRIVRTL
jgi:hypothetical protein